MKPRFTCKGCEGFWKGLRAAEVFLSGCGATEDSVCGKVGKLENKKQKNKCFSKNSNQENLWTTF